MLPKEFVDRFGRPIIRVARATAARPEVVAANDDRYLLVFVGQVGNNSNVAPVGFNAITGGAWNLIDGAPTIFTHALHGSLVNMAWLAFNNFQDEDITIVEGLMIGLGLDNEGDLARLERESIRASRNSDQSPPPDGRGSFERSHSERSTPGSADILAAVRRPRIFRVRRGRGT